MLSRVHWSLWCCSTSAPSQGYEMCRAVLVCIWKLDSNKDKYQRLELHEFIFFSSSNIAIYGGWWQSGDSAPQHGHVVPSQQDRQPLPQLPCHLLLLLPKLPSQLPPKLGNNIQSSPMPAPKGVHSQGNEADGFCCAAVLWRSGICLSLTINRASLNSLVFNLSTVSSFQFLVHNHHQPSQSAHHNFCQNFANWPNPFLNKWYNIRFICYAHLSQMIITSHTENVRICDWVMNKRFPTKDDPRGCAHKSLSANQTLNPVQV